MKQLDYSKIQQDLDTDIPDSLEDAINRVRMAKDLITHHQSINNVLKLELSSTKDILQKTVNGRKSLEKEFQNLQDTNKLLSQSVSNAQNSAKNIRHK